MRVLATWSVTEQHSTVIEVGDDFDPEVDLDDSALAEVEEARTYVSTTDRELLAWTEVKEGA